MMKRYAILICCLNILTFFQQTEAIKINTRDMNKLKPFGLRRTYDRGFGDRYYSGIPAYNYHHLWPKWKSTLRDNQNLWRYRHAPEWISYYSYPFITWPNYYYEFGAPYYYNTKPKYIENTMNEEQTK